MKHQIPKKIHQISISQVEPRPFPEEIQRNIDSIRSLNPDWQYNFYCNNDAVDFIQQHYPDALEAYHLINPEYGAAKADLFRYILMYIEGGCYLDLKSSFTKPLDQVIRTEDEMLLAHWDNQKGDRYEGWGFCEQARSERGEYLQSFIVCIPKHPYLKTVVEQVIKNINNYTPSIGVGRHGVVSTTGPIAYTLAIDACDQERRHRMIDVKEDGFQFSIYDALYGRKSKKNHNKVFGRHYTKLKKPLVGNCSVTTTSRFVSHLRKMIGG